MTMEELFFLPVIDSIYKLRLKDRKFSVFFFMFSSKIIKEISTFLFFPHIFVIDNNIIFML